MREVRVHRRGEGRLPGPAAVPDAEGVAGRVLRLADAPPPRGAGADRRAVGARDRDDSRGEPTAVWVSPDPRRTGRPRLPHESQTGGPPDAGARRGGASPAAVPGDDAVAYIPTGEGWLYLAVILDLCSRFAVGWAMSARITDELTLNALGMALARRRPPQGLLHHSDRGSQYASGDYQRVLAHHGIVCSMSRRGDCWDNAVAESFFATLKVELVHDAAWATRAAACTELFEYLELFYNGQRRHSALGYLSPRAFERRLDHEASAA